MGKELELFFRSFFHTESFHYLFQFLSFFSHFCFLLKKPDPPPAGVNEILPLTLKEMKKTCPEIPLQAILFSLFLYSYTLLFIVSVCDCSLMFQLIDFPSLVLSSFTTHTIFLSRKEISILLYKQLVC